MSLFTMFVITIYFLACLFLWVLFVAILQPKIKSTFDESNEAFYIKGYPGIEGGIPGEIIVRQGEIVFKKLFREGDIFKIPIEDIKEVNTAFLAVWPLAISGRRWVLKINYQDRKGKFLVRWHTRSGVSARKIKEDIERIKISYQDRKG